MTSQKIHVNGDSLLNTYKYFLNLALNINALLMKPFYNSRKWLLAEIITVKLKPSLLLNALLHIHSHTLITETLHLVATIGSLHVSLYGWYGLLFNFFARHA